MKRSKALYIIQREIELRVDRYGALVYPSIEIAKDILEELEILGMLPPKRFNSPEGGWEHVWDPENE